MSVFLAISLPFQEIYFLFSWQAFAAILLILYLAVKYGYGLIIKSFSEYASPTMQLLPALIIISIITFPKAAPKNIFIKNSGGAVKVILARIPNTIGMLAENAVISISLADYSFIQPMILITLFMIGLARKEQYSRLNLIGSILCIIGVISFQISFHDFWDTIFWVLTKTSLSGFTILITVQNP